MPPQAPTQQPRELSWDEVIEHEAKAANVHPALAKAVASVENAPHDPTATSPKGAIGPMQLMPETAKRLGVDIHDPVQNIRGGVRELRRLLDQNGGDVEKALRLYNASPGAAPALTDPYVQKVFARLHGSATPASAPTQTRVPYTGDPNRKPVSAEDFIGKPPPGQTIGPGPSWATRFSRIATPTVGAIGGGIVGGVAGAPAGPVGAAMGAVAGAGTGAGIGEAVQAGGERLLSRWTGEPPPTAAGIVSRVGAATETGMEGEMGGRIATPILQRTIVAPFANKLKPTAQAAIQAFTTKAGKPLVLPSEVSSSQLLNVAQNIADASLIGGARGTALRAARQQFAEQQVLDVLNTMGGATTPSEAGAAVLQGHADAVAAFRAGSKQLYDHQFLPLAKGIPAQTPNLDAWAEANLPALTEGRVIPNAGLRAAESMVKQYSEEGATEVIAGKRVALADLTPQQRMAYGQVMNLDRADTGTRTAATLWQTRSDLGTLSTRLTRAAARDPSKMAEAGLVKHLYQLVTDDLEHTLAPHPEAATAFEAANTYARLGNERLFNAQVRSIVKEAPEKISGALAQRNNSTAIEAVRKAVGPEAFQQVQRSTLERIIAADPKSGAINWKQVQQRIANLGDDSGSALFPGGHLTQVRRTADLLSSLTSKTTAGNKGKIWIQFGQAGAVSGLVYGHNPVAATGILLTPALLARVMASPTGIKWLTTGLSAPAGTAAAARAGSQILAFLEQERQQAEAEDASRVGQPPPVQAKGTHVGQPPPR